MDVLVVDPTYPESEELGGTFRRELRKDLSAAFPEASVLEVDAGPSASIPALLATISGTVDVVALFAAPLLLQQSLGWYKAQISKLREFLDKRSLSYSLDESSAALLAADAVLKGRTAESELRLVSLTRHCANLSGVWSDYVEILETRDPETALDKHFRAVRMLNVQYVLLIEYEHEAYTVVVRKNGDVLHVDSLGH